MVEKSRDVEPLAQLNAQVVEIFSAGEIESGHPWFARVRYWRLGSMFFHVEEPLAAI